MINQEDIATALLSVELPNEDVAGLMLELSDIKSPVKMPTPPCSTSVERVTKKGWAKTATAVLSGTKEYLGSKLTKHSSIQVRRLLAQYATDQNALRELHDWALTKDRETLEHLVGRLDVDWLLSCLEAGVQYPPRPRTTIAHRAAHAGDTSLDRIAALPAETSRPMLLAATNAIATNPSTRWNLPALLDGKDDDFCEQVAMELALRYNAVVTEALMNDIMEHPVLRKRIVSQGFNNSTGFDVSAARMYISLNPLHAKRVIRDSWNPVLFDDIIATKRLEVLETLLSDESCLRSLTPDQIDQALLASETADWTSSSYRAPSLNRHLLQHVSHELSTEVLLAYLRHSDEHATWQWLTGKYNQTPRPGEITLLAKNQGWSFGWAVLYNANGNSGARYASASVEEVARDISHKFEQLVTQPWCDELVDTFGSDVFEHLVRAYSPEGRKYLVARITKELGSDPEVWRDALAHFGKSRLSVGKTLTAIRLLRTASSTPRP